MKHLRLNLKRIMLFALVVLITLPSINVEARTGYHTTYCDGCKTDPDSVDHTIGEGTPSYPWGNCQACGQYVKMERKTWGYTCNNTWVETAAQINIVAGYYDKNVWCSGTDNEPNGGKQSGTVTCSNHTRRWCPGHESANTYYIKFIGNGNTSGEMSNTMICKYDQSHTLTANAYAKTDYKFLGWSTSPTGTVMYTDKQSISNLTSTDGQTIHLYAIWEPDEYTITLGGTLDGTDISNIANYGTTDVYVNGTLTANDTSTFSQSIKYNLGYEFTDIKAKTGYTYVGASSVKGVVDADKTVRLAFTTNYYNLKLNAGTGIKSVSGAGSKKYTSSVSIDAVVKPGYTWKNWTGDKYSTTKNYVFTMPYNDVTLTANATPNKDTPYKVEHYQQNIYDDNYNLVYTDNLKGTTDTTVTPAVKTYTGFTSPSAQSANINGDGSTVVRYYYRRNSYPVNTIKGAGIASVSGAGSYRYGATVTVDAVVLEGYTWKNWTGDLTSTNKKFTFTMPAKNVTLTANATANTYYVQYAKGTTNAGGSTAKTSHVFDKDVVLAANGFIGRSYKVTFNGNRPDTIGQIQNLPSTMSGNLQFKHWQVKATYNSGNYAASTSLGVKNFESAHGATANATAVWNSKTLTWGKPTLVGYDFMGWRDSAGTTSYISSLTINPNTSAFNASYTAIWKARNDTPYVVKHWVQKIDAASDEHNSTNFTLVETEQFKGTSDSYVTPAVKIYEGCNSPATVTVRIQADGSTVVNYYYERKKLTLNIDGEYLKIHYPNTNGLCTFDMYINDKLVANDVKDYYSESILYGSKWFVSDIKPVSGKNYTGNDIEKH